jgi:hypothetical protein
VRQSKGCKMKTADGRAFKAPTSKLPTHRMARSNLSCEALSDRKRRQIIAIGVHGRSESGSRTESRVRAQSAIGCSYLQYLVDVWTMVTW